jgi:hypothetical protein
VDAALRPFLSGRETPLILAATGRLVLVFHAVNSYRNLLPDSIDNSPDRISDGDLATAARPILDAAYAKQIKEARDLFEVRAGEGRSTADISDAARAATFGAIDTLLVDIDSVVHGTVDETTGEVHFAEEADATNYGIVDEIAGRALASGAKVMGVRRSDLPAQGDLAAILRFASPG